MNKPTFLDDVEYKACSAAQSGKEWNWLNPQCGAFSHPANYYESSLQAWHEFEPLNADIECDVVVRRWLTGSIGCTAFFGAGCRYGLG